MGRGFGVAAAVGVDVVRDIAAQAEQLGYTSFWCNDTPGADGLECLAAAAAVTHHIQLGVGVIPMDRRSPESILADIDRLGLPTERLLLGVGAGGDRSVENVRNGILALKGQLDAPVIVGTLGPKMTAAAGEVGDGVLFNWQTPESAVQFGQICIDAAAAVGRPKPLIMEYVRTAILPQGGERLQKEAERYGRIPAYKAHLERIGKQAIETAVSSTDHAELQHAILQHELQVDEAVVRAITPDDSSVSILELMRACAPGH